MCCSWLEVVLCPGISGGLVPTSLPPIATSRNSSISSIPQCHLGLRTCFVKVINLQPPFRKRRKGGLFEMHHHSVHLIGKPPPIPCSITSLPGWERRHGGSFEPPEFPRDKCSSNRCSWKAWRRCLLVCFPSKQCGCHVVGEHVFAVIQCSRSWLSPTSSRGMNSTLRARDTRGDLAEPGSRAGAVGCGRPRAVTQQEQGPCTEDRPLTAQGKNLAPSSWHPPLRY